MTNANPENQPATPEATTRSNFLRDQIAELKKGDAPPVKREVKYDRKLQTNVVKKQRR